MDRFQSEPYAAPSHFRSEEAYLDWMANQEPEPVEEIVIDEDLEPIEAAVLSECCGAEIRVEMRESSVCPETGYREEGGPFDVCSACGSDFEPMVQPVFKARVPSKPISRQQGDLFEEVA